jgi:molybdopterin synthase sulfur carrier subunit
MKIKVLYLASLREQVGARDEDLEIPPEVTTVADVRALLQSRGGAWQSALAQGRAVRIAVNQEIALATTPVRQGDEVAFFPPVTGG